MLDKNIAKSAVLNSGIDRETSKACFSDFRNGGTANLEGLIALYGYDLVETALRLNQAKWKRKRRVQNRIEWFIASGEVVFLTLTFNDETLAKTSTETRRTYVRKYLKRYASEYVANIDFGGQNGREHYHALAVMQGDFDYKEWHKYGAIKGEKVRTKESDIERTCKYVAKLSNHAMKVDGKAPRLIYSRKRYEELPPAWLLEDDC